MGVGAQPPRRGVEPFPFTSFQALILALAIMMVIGPIEEFGWRGLAQPLLQRRFALFGEHSMPFAEQHRLIRLPIISVDDRSMIGLLQFHPNQSIIILGALPPPESPATYSELLKSLPAS
jgi:hypothetical protein